MDAFASGELELGNGVYALPIINGVTIDSAGDLTTALDLASAVLGQTFNKRRMASARNIWFHMIVEDKAGTVDVDVEGINGAQNGTSGDFETVATLPTMNVNANEIFAPVQIAALPPVNALKLNATNNGTLDGSNNFTLYAWLTFITDEHHF